MSKKQVNIRMSDATRAKLDELVERYGTQAEAVAVAIDRLYQQERKESKMKRLWVIEWRPGNQSVIPSPELCPDLDDFEVVVADPFFAVVNASYEQVEAAVRDFPYWQLTGQPADGRWVAESGDEVYILNGEIIEKQEKLWDGLGFRPETFGAESWDQVDEDIVWDHVPSF